MALNIYSNPDIASQLTYQGGAALGAGIGHGLTQLGEGVGKYLEVHKKESQETDALRKLAVTQGWADKDTVNKMGLGELRGFQQGKVMEQANQLHAAQIAHYAALNQEAQASAASRQAQTANMGKFQGFMGELENQTMPSIEGAGPLSNYSYDQQRTPINKFARALKESGYNPGADTDNMMKLFMPNQGAIHESLPMGAVLNLPNGDRLTGLGEGRAPHLTPASELNDFSDIDPKKYPGLFSLNPVDFNKAYTEAPADIRKKAAVLYRNRMAPGLGQMVAGQAAPSFGTEPTKALPVPISEAKEPKNKAEFDALPPGSYYKRNGKTWQKP